METSTDIFSKDERELISHAITNINCSHGLIKITIMVRKCFGQPVEETLTFTEENLLKMLKQINRRDK